MATSYATYKKEITDYLKSNFDKNAKILDVGAGEGTYLPFLQDYFTNIEAVEVFKPNIDNFNLEERYKKVYNINIIDFKYDFYDIIIFGDVIEHLEVNDAKKVLKYALNRCKEMIVAVPYLRHGIVGQTVKYLKVFSKRRILQINAFAVGKSVFWDKLLGYDRIKTLEAVFAFFIMRFIQNTDDALSVQYLLIVFVVCGSQISHEDDVTLFSCIHDLGGNLITGKHRCDDKLRHFFAVTVGILRHDLLEGVLDGADGAVAEIGGPSVIQQHVRLVLIHDG